VKVRLRLDARELAVLAVLLLWVGVPWTAMVLGSRGDTWNGTFWLFGPIDILQYAAWIRELGGLQLVSNKYDLPFYPHDFLHPLFLISGLLWRAGLSIQASYLVWEPVAIAAMFAGYVAYVRRMVVGHWYRLAALAVALFSFSPITALVNWANIGDFATRAGFIAISVETSQAGTLWGALPTALTFALMPLVFLGVGRGLRALDHRDRRAATIQLGLVSAGALLLSWLHPWQGITTLLVLAGLAVWGRLARRYWALLPVIVATLLPIAYYFLLARYSPIWHYVGAPNDNRHLGWFLLALAPLVLIAPFGYRGRADDDQEKMLRLWPVAALTLYIALRQSLIYHALESLTLPLAVLAVRAMQGGGSRAVGRMVTVATVLLLTLPGTIFQVQYLIGTLSDRQQIYITPDESEALAFLASDPRPGGVLARLQMSTEVPTFTGRHTWMGHPQWTPGFISRNDTAEAIFSGSLSPTQTRKTIETIGPTYVVVRCQDRSDFDQVLAGDIAETHQFGCVRVYRLSIPYQVITR
jgi:hypothetical protein